MAKRIKPTTNMIIGARLKQVIEVYFGNQKEFAEKAMIDNSSVSSYCNGTLILSDKIATKIQERTGISKDYIFNGMAPMMLDDSIKPIKDIAKPTGISDKLKSEREELYAKEGSIRFNIMSRQGMNSTLFSQKEISVIGLTINGINTKDAQATEINDKIFVNTYKNHFPIADNCIIITSDIWGDGDGVLLKYWRDHRIAVLDNEKYYDVITRDVIEISDENVVGRIYKILNMFEINWS